MAHEQDPTQPDGIRVGEQTPKGNEITYRARDRKANAAIQLRIAGATWDEIAEIVGYPTGRHAIVATERALEKELKTEESQKAMRSMAGKRLDRLMRGIWKKAIDPDHPEQLQAVEAARKLVDRHAKLFGLDAPTEYVVTSPSQSELEQWVSRVVSQQTVDLKEPDIFDVEWSEDDEGDEGGQIAIPTF